MSKYRITISNPGGRFCNPLLGLRGEEFEEREEACEAIYSALYDVIDSAEGFEMVDPPDWNSFGDDDDEEYCHAKDEYIKSCHDYILREGWATEDGVTATVEEIETGTLRVCDRDGNNAEPINPNDEQMTFDDFIDALNFNDGDGLTFRRATPDDDCGPRVDALAINSDGEICGYYRWFVAEEAAE